MAKKKKLPADTNKKAKAVVAMAIGEDAVGAIETRTPAQILGSAGGKKGGPARANKLTAKRRKEIAQKAAAARWGHK